jgi:hypothetical protein
VLARGAVEKLESSPQDRIGWDRIARIGSSHLGGGFVFVWGVWGLSFRNLQQLRKSSE